MNNQEIQIPENTARQGIDAQAINKILGLDPQNNAQHKDISERIIQLGTNFPMPEQTGPDGSEVAHELTPNKMGLLINSVGYTIKARLPQFMITGAIAAASVIAPPAATIIFATFGIGSLWNIATRGMEVNSDIEKDDSLLERTYKKIKNIPNSLGIAYNRWYDSVKENGLIFSTALLTSWTLKTLLSTTGIGRVAGLIPDIAAEVATRYTLTKGQVSLRERARTHLNTIRENSVPIEIGGSRHRVNIDQLQSSILAMTPNTDQDSSVWSSSNAVIRALYDKDGKVTTVGERLLEMVDIDTTSELSPEDKLVVMRKAWDVITRTRYELVKSFTDYNTSLKRITAVQAGLNIGTAIYGLNDVLRIGPRYWEMGGEKTQQLPFIKSILERRDQAIDDFSNTIVPQQLIQATRDSYLTGEGTKEFVENNRLRVFTHLLSESQPLVIFNQDFSQLRDIFPAK